MVAAVGPYNVQLVDINGAALISSAGADGRANTETAQLVDARPLLYNGPGLTFDRQRGNTEGTLLASAARTVQTTSANQTNHNARGLVLTVDVTAASGTGGLQPRIYAIDPVTGKTGQSLFPASTPLVATGTFTYVLYPGVVSAAGPTAVVSEVLPRTWVMAMLVGDASSYTYSVGYSLII